MVTTKIYTEPQVNKKEILRYAGCRNLMQEGMLCSKRNDVEADNEYEDVQRGDIETLLEECLAEALPRLSYKLCYLELPLAITGDTCDFGCMQVQSKDLVKNLTGCERVILFGATIGVEIDRLIARYAHISPAKAVMFQAIGAERIEALCDAFCEDIGKKVNEEADENIESRFQLCPRFSPGYGDLPLEVQRDIFMVLNSSKNIGVSLNTSLLMTPSKSVTAFVGMNRMKKIEKRKCDSCKKTDCAYREE